MVQTRGAVNNLDTNVFKGLAIIMVITVHTSQMFQGLNRILGIVSEFGQMGCQLFFLLSGYGLCFSWANMEQDPWGIRYKKYLMKRWTKVIVPYYAAIVLFIVYHYLVVLLDIPSMWDHPLELEGIISLFLLVNGFIPKYNNYLMIGAWYIGTTVVFYVLFPLVYEIVKNISLKYMKIISWGLGMIPVAVLALAVMICKIEIPKVNTFWYFSAINQFPCFFLGILLYFKCKNKNSVEKVSTLECVVKMCIWFLIFAGLYWKRESIWFSVAIICFACGQSFYWMCILSIKCLEQVEQKNVVFSTMTNMLRKYGRVSYYAFLIHGFFVRDFLYWILPNIKLNMNFLYVICLLFVWCLVYLSCEYIVRK